MINKYFRSIIKSQGGYASFVITLITIIVLSLIVIAFAADARLEQSDSLANVLATQAYYAAESGINDAVALIQADITSDPPVPVVSSTSGDCTPSQYEKVGTKYLYSGNGTDSVLYSCLNVNVTPPSLNYQPITPGEGQVVTLNSYNSTSFNTLTISWVGYDVNNPTFGGCPSAGGANASLPELNASASPDFNPANCGAGVLQLDLVSDNALNSNPEAPAETIFLEPDDSGTATDNNDAPSSQDQVYYVGCNATTPNTGIYACTQTINFTGSGIPGFPDTIYYLHLQSFYQANDVNITAKDTSGNAVDFSNAQVLIDSTGDANGQLKRLVERVCYGDYCNNASPDGAIISTECINKGFSVYPNDAFNTAPPSSCPPPS